MGSVGVRRWELQGEGGVGLVNCVGKGKVEGQAWHDMVWGLEWIGRVEYGRV